MTHCSPDTPAPKCLPMVGRATLTTVASSEAIPEPDDRRDQDPTALGRPVPDLTGRCWHPKVLSNRRGYPDEFQVQA